MASDLGRLIDGVGGYIANLGVVVGIGLGFSETIPTLFGLTFITILRAIAYDYSKQAMTARIKDGEDWAQMEQDKIESQMKSTPSVLLTLYHGYLRFQRMVFEGRSGAANSSKNHGPQIKGLHSIRPTKGLSLWKWNGPDLVFYYGLRWSDRQSTGTTFAFDNNCRCPVNLNPLHPQHPDTV